MIADDIEQKIVEKKYKVSELLPSENTLCAQYSVTRTTVRRALALLIKSNFITPIPGKGYVVNMPAKSEFLFSFDEISVLDRHPVDTQLLSVNIISPTLELMLKLQITPNKKVVNVKRLFSCEGVPLGFDDKYITYYTGIPIVEKEIHYMTFPNIFAKNRSVRELDEQLVISACRADAYLASLLKIKVNAAVTAVEQIIKNSDGTVLGCGTTYYTAGSVRLQAKSR